MDDTKFSQEIEFLAEQGLNLLAILACVDLPEEVTQAMLAEDIPLPDYTSLVLIGHGGWRLWQALTVFGMKTADPVDHFSRVMPQRFIDDFLAGPPVLMLYPTGYNIPLQKLGALAGWHHPSPLGLGINETYGLWFAYRAAFLTTLPLPSIQEPITPSPCDTCEDKPCIKACPDQATGGVTTSWLASRSPATGTPHGRGNCSSAQRSPGARDYPPGLKSAGPAPPSERPSRRLSHHPWPLDQGGTGPVGPQRIPDHPV